jgi:signal peptidase I
MDFDFAVILFVLVLATSVFWILDKFVFKGAGHGAIEYTGSFFPILLIVFFLRSFLFEPFQIPSGSMIPTLEVGDFIVVNKYSYGVRLPIIGNKIIPIGDPQRGDVIVFIPPHDERYFIKRLVGLPGDHIQVIQNQVYVNDQELDQNFIARLGANAYGYTDLIEETDGEVIHEIQVKVPATRLGINFETVVQEGHYFMMGDNRDNSLDSREWGSVPESNIVGKAVAVWMHWEPWSIPSFSTAGSIR